MIRNRGRTGTERQPLLTAQKNKKRDWDRTPTNAGISVGKLTATFTKECYAFKNLILYLLLKFCSTGVLLRTEILRLHEYKISAMSNQCRWSTS